jgi:hypothetical protein
MTPETPADPWRPVEPLLVPVEVFAELDVALVCKRRASGARTERSRRIEVR